MPEPAALPLALGATVEAGDGYEVACYRSLFGGLIGQVYCPGPGARSADCEIFRARDLRQASEHALRIIAKHRATARRPPGEASHG